MITKTAINLIWCNPDSIIENRPCKLLGGNGMIEHSVSLRRAWGNLFQKKLFTGDKLFWANL